MSRSLSCDDRELLRETLVVLYGMREYLILLSSHTQVDTNRFDLPMPYVCLTHREKARMAGLAHCRLMPVINQLQKRLDTDHLSEF